MSTSIFLKVAFCVYSSIFELRIFHFVTAVPHPWKQNDLSTIVLIIFQSASLSNLRTIFKAYTKTDTDMQTGWQTDEQTEIQTLKKAG